MRVRGRAQGMGNIVSFTFNFLKREQAKPDTGAG